MFQEGGSLLVCCVVSVDFCPCPKMSHSSTFVVCICKGNYRHQKAARAKLFISYKLWARMAGSGRRGVSEMIIGEGY
jgi:hypothetical protein